MGTTVLSKESGKQDKQSKQLLGWPRGGQSLLFVQTNCTDTGIFGKLLSNAELQHPELWRQTTVLQNTRETFSFTLTHPEAPGGRMESIF